MKKHHVIMKNICILLLLFFISHQSLQAQYVYTETFSNPTVLAGSRWSVFSPKQTTFRDTVNGNATPGPGCLHVSFTDMRSGDIDSLTIPKFTATTAGDSIFFDHAHRAKFIGADSVEIRYSSNGGLTFSHLHTYLGSATPGPTTLSTEMPSFIGGKFRPLNATMWAHKSLALPVGTNRVQLIFYSDGGDELYLDNIRVGKTPSVCTSPAFAGKWSSSVTTCAGSENILTPDSLIYNPLLVYQWQTSIDSGITDPWTNITNIGGINSYDLFVSSVASPRWYRLEITCPSTSSTLLSSPVHIAMDSLYNCYCRSNLGGFCNVWITNVSLLGTSLSNSSACNDVHPSNKFTYYPPSPTTFDTITAGNPFTTIQVSTDRFGPWLSGEVGFWIDYNRNGTFEASEFQMVNTNLNNTTASLTFTVPATALPGITGLRIRCIEGSGLSGAFGCSNLSSGETEDYLIYIKPQPICGGMPIAGTTTASNTLVCTGEPVTLKQSGPSFGSGIVYLWQESLDNGLTDPWHAATGTGVNTFSLSVSSLTATHHYRMLVICTNTNDTAFGSPIMIGVKPAYLCYCNTNLGGSQCARGSSYISNVTVANSVINHSTGCAPSGYLQVGITPTAYDTFNIGELITVNVTAENVPSQIGMWIDYNQNQLFENSEFSLVSISSLPGIPASKSLIIPSGTLIGNTGMRIRITDKLVPFSGMDACTNFSAGETHDYVINIQPAPACAGIPSPGTMPSHVSVCAGDSLTLQTSGASYGTGVVYLWESSLDGGIASPWSNVTSGTGFTTSLYTSGIITDTIYFRLKIICSSSGIIRYSDSVFVSLKPFYECYCSANLGAGNSCAFGEYISNVSFVGGNLNNTSTCLSTGVNNNYTFNNPTGTATDTVRVGDYVTLSVTYNGEPARIAAWLDYNHNGTFDSSEFTLITATTATNNTVQKTIEIPASALHGKTGIRIRTTCATCPLDPIDACANIVSGETEDYIIQIDSASSCSGAPIVGSLPSSHLMCANTPFTLTPSGSVFKGGINYHWQESDDNGVTDAWDTLAAQTTRTLNISGLTTGKYYRLKAVCMATLDSSFSNSTHVVLDSFYNCYDASTDLGGNGCFGGAAITNVTIAKTDLNNSSSCSVTPFGTRTLFPPSRSTTATLIASGTYTVEVEKNTAVSIGVWIDYDRNGTFDPLEFTLVTPLSFGRSVESATFTVPATATPGLTGMRVRTNIPIPFGGLMSPINAATNFAGGETEDYVITLDTLKPVTNVILSGIQNNEVTVSWNNGNGHGRVVLAKETATPLTNPTNGTSFRGASDIFGTGDSTATGNYIVYNSDRDTSVTVTGLNLMTSYEFYVYEFIAGASGPVYALPGMMAAGVTLPVKLSSFNGRVSQNDVILNWNTASEINNDGFAIERSVDGIAFENIGFVKGNGTSSSLHSYMFTDKNAFEQPKHEMLYYRLRQQDYNGSSSCSKTICVTKGKLPVQQIVFAPNPFSKELTLSAYVENSTHVTVKVTDLSGKAVADIPLQLEKGSNILTLSEVSGLKAGVYFLELHSQENITRHKIIKAE